MSIIIFIWRMGGLLGSAGDTSRKNTVVWPSSRWQQLKPPTTRNGRFFPSVLLLTSTKNSPATTTDITVVVVVVVVLET